MGFRVRIEGWWGSYYHIPKPIFYLLKGDEIIRKLKDPMSPTHAKLIGGRQSTEGSSFVRQKNPKCMHETVTHCT